MKKIINSKVYNTQSEGIILLAEEKIEKASKAFNRFYKTKNGNYFCHFSSESGPDDYEDIRPLTPIELEDELFKLGKDAEIKWDQFEEA